MHLLLVLFFLFPVFTEASNKAPLRAGVPITLPPPLLFLDQNTPQGILPEFISSLAQILGREHSVLALARLLCRNHWMSLRGSSSERPWITLIQT